MDLNADSSNGKYGIQKIPPDLRGLTFLQS